MSITVHDLMNELQLPGRNSLVDYFKTVRNFTEELTSPLETEDFVIQSMPDVSPAKWHLAHTSWFFEKFLLSAFKDEYKPFRHIYDYLFNSYYVLAGERHCRPKRGLISRPTVSEVFEYRRHIDNMVLDMIEKSDEDTYSSISYIIIIGINHEQQHQELILTDIKHVFSENPLDPVYSGSSSEVHNTDLTPKQSWVDFPEGIYNIGNKGDSFGYDNEFPIHKAYLRNFRLATVPVTNGEYIEFIENGGYRKPELWLSDGWSTLTENNWDSPLYWYRKDSRWYCFTLSGSREVDPDEPICHVSFYEADAFARWSGYRLPTEFEWEVASAGAEIEGNFVESGKFHPSASLSNTGSELQKLFGDVWEWTSSPYAPYPGYKTLPGALGEYNGKFMCNQMVLRGGSCATSKSHIRRTYRNFFPPDARWQFSGIRLADDV